MDSSRGARRPPVLAPTRRLTAATALLGALLLAHPDSGAAQPSPNLSSWLRAQRPSVLATGIEVQGEPAIPPGSVIGEVRVVAKDLFDPEKPGEDGRLFRLANQVHRSTRPGVIERQLLFKPGDVFSPELIAESARLLRQNDYLYDVDIRPVLRDDGKVDVEVTTRDVWTLEGGASFSRSGGTNNGSLWLEDTNVLGTGKEVSVSRIGTVDRTSNLIRFRDPNPLLQAPDTSRRRAPLPASRIGARPLLFSRHLAPLPGRFRAVYSAGGRFSRQYRWHTVFHQPQ